VFWFRARCGFAEFAFTDARCDLRDAGENATTRRRLSEAFGVSQVAVMRQVHGADVATADPAVAPEADALIVDRPGVAALVRVADCVPIVLAATDRPVAAVIHAGRKGMMARIASATALELRAHGAGPLHAWIGPHACPRCYEVPEEMAEEVERVVPGTRSVTSRGTPSVDLGAGVTAQLRELDVEVTDLGGCTIEDERFHSHRRQGPAAGRFGAVAALREQAS